MPATAVVEVDADLKNEAERILAASGHSVAEVVRTLLRRTVEEHAIPAGLYNKEKNFTSEDFDPDHVFDSSAETVVAMRELEAGGGKCFASVEALMADLNADD